MQMLRNKSAHIKVFYLFFRKLTQNVVLLGVEKRTQRGLRRGANRDAVNVLARLLAAWQRLQLLEQRVKISLAT